MLFTSCFQAAVCVADRASLPDGRRASVLPDAVLAVAPSPLPSSQSLASLYRGLITHTHNNRVFESREMLVLESLTSCELPPSLLPSISAQSQSRLDTAPTRSCASPKKSNTYP